MADTNIDEIVKVWKDYVAGMDDWQKLVEDVEPKQTQCGPVYEPASPLPERTETFAISDMRNIDYAKPHYHKGGETEIYIVVSGTGTTVIGGEELDLEPGVVAVTPPGIGHFTIPKENLVMAVINSPSFKAENVVDLEESNEEVGYDANQLARLTK